MARIYEKAWLDGGIVPLNEATLSITSSAVLYGLSVYTVLPVIATKNGLLGFRLSDHEARIHESARIIGIDTDMLVPGWLERAARMLIESNEVTTDVFIRATLHVSEQLPGVRSRGLATSLSAFAYEANPILPQTGARVKTSVWRRVPDAAIPARAKVNGAYVNSVLGKQDALDSGYDDCLFLDGAGHVCELSAANLFLVRRGVLITPAASQDLLEGISRRTLIEVAQGLGYTVEERSIDLTECYIADEAFACGTSAKLAPIVSIDARQVGSGVPGPVTLALREAYERVLRGEDPGYADYLISLTPSI